MPPTPQELNWSGPKGDSYAATYLMKPGKLDRRYKARMAGESRSDTFNHFLADVSEEAAILEVGCNVGNQLALLRTLGYTNLSGVDICEAACNRARVERHLPVKQGSILDLPYQDSEFDLVFSCWVISHIAPADLPRAISEMARVSRKWIMGTECYEPMPKLLRKIPENGEGYLWASDYAQEFLDRLPDWELVDTRMHRPTSNIHPTETYLLRRV